MTDFGFSREWSIATPANTGKVSAGANEIRNVREDVAERLCDMTLAYTDICDPSDDQKGDIEGQLITTSDQGGLFRYDATNGWWMPLSFTEFTHVTTDDTLDSESLTNMIISAETDTEEWTLHCWPGGYIKFTVTLAAASDATSAEDYWMSIRIYNQTRSDYIEGNWRMGFGAADAYNGMCGIFIDSDPLNGGSDEADVIYNVQAALSSTDLADVTVTRKLIIAERFYM